MKVYSITGGHLIKFASNNMPKGQKSNISAPCADQEKFQQSIYKSPEESFNSCPLGLTNLPQSTISAISKAKIQQRREELLSNNVAEIQKEAETNCKTIEQRIADLKQEAATMIESGTPDYYLSNMDVIREDIEREFLEARELADKIGLYNEFYRSCYLEAPRSGYKDGVKTLKLSNAVSVDIRRNIHGLQIDKYVYGKLDRIITFRSNNVHFIDVAINPTRTGFDSYEAEKEYCKREYCGGVHAENLYTGPFRGYDEDQYEALELYKGVKKDGDSTEAQEAVRFYHSAIDYHQGCTYKDDYMRLEHADKSLFYYNGGKWNQFSLGYSIDENFLYYLSRHRKYQECIVNGSNFEYVKNAEYLAATSDFLKGVYDVYATTTAEAPQRVNHYEISSKKEGNITEYQSYEDKDGSAQYVKGKIDEDNLTNETEYMRVDLPKSTKNPQNLPFPYSSIPLYLSFKLNAIQEKNGGQTGKQVVTLGKTKTHYTPDFKVRNIETKTEETLEIDENGRIIGYMANS